MRDCHELGLCIVVSKRTGSNDFNHHRIWPLRSKPYQTQRFPQPQAYRLCQLREMQHTVRVSEDAYWRQPPRPWPFCCWCIGSGRRCRCLMSPGLSSSQSPAEPELMNPSTPMVHAFITNRLVLSRQTGSSGKYCSTAMKIRMWRSPPDWFAFVVFLPTTPTW